MESRPILDLFHAGRSVRENGRAGRRRRDAAGDSMGSLLFFTILLRVSSVSLKKSIALPIEQLLECMDPPGRRAPPTSRYARTFRKSVG